MTGIVQTPTNLLQVTGGKTISNNVAFSVHLNNVNFVLPSGAVTKLPFTTKEFDQDASYDTSAFRFSPKPGLYLFMAGAALDSATDLSNLDVLLFKNGSSYKVAFSVTSSTVESGCVLSCIALANPGDYFELMAFQLTGVNQTISGITKNTWFQGVQLG